MNICVITFIIIIGLLDERCWSCCCYCWFHPLFFFLLFSLFEYVNALLALLLLYLEILWFVAFFNRVLNSHSSRIHTFIIILCGLCFLWTMKNINKVLKFLFIIQHTIWATMRCVKRPFALKFSLTLTTTTRRRMFGV